jgi:double-stranded uracil-DNA glycosylase
VTAGAARRPTRAEIAAAAGRRVPDVIAADLRVLFCGINPGLYSGAVGHHFARPGNRFWPALAASGFTARVLRPEEEDLLLRSGLGITNLVARATASAAELDPEELRRGVRTVRRKARTFAPRVVAFLGLGAYRIAFGRRAAVVGPQPERLGPAAVWLLPNPSGLNAHWRPAELAREFAELRAFLGRRRGA